jgi:small multidrug resistance family-3 protein
MIGGARRGVDGAATRAKSTGNRMTEWIKIAALFAATALAEIVGCYLPWLVLKAGRPLWLLVPAALSLALFAWLLTLHPSAAGRTYAAYGGVYIAVALVWLRVVDGIALTRWDVAGAVLALGGMALIALQPRV